MNDRKRKRSIRTRRARLAGIALAGSILGMPLTAAADRVFTGRGDLDNNGVVEQMDLDIMQQCASGGVGGGCGNPCRVNKTDMDGDGVGYTLADQSVPSSYINNPGAHEAELAVDSTTVYNYTSDVNNNFHCRELLVLAYESLGFSPPQGFYKGDRLFCGDWYLAWIDATGFQGELNGLWTMNGEGQPAGQLDFAATPDGLPRNLLTPGENRNGQWPAGYSGAIHIEIGNRVREDADDPPGCDTTPGPGIFCNAYGLNQAGSFAKPGWWEACNGGSPSFTQHFEPYEIVPDGTALTLRLVWETALTKEADFTVGCAEQDTDCVCHSPHASWIFPDNGSGSPVRGDMRVRTGLELSGTTKSIYFTYNLNNNTPYSTMPPTPAHGQYLVSGVTLTSLTNPPPGKQFRAYINARDDGAPPANQQFTTTCGSSSKTITENQWFHNGAFPICQANDWLLGFWPTWSVSTQPANVLGQTVLYRYETWPAFADDNNLCECKAHDALEIGGKNIDLFEAPPFSVSEEHRFEMRLVGFP